VRWPYLQTAVDRCRDEVSDAFGPERLAEEWAQGRQMPADEALALALEELEGRGDDLIGEPASTAS
jgi:hypothetical protein